MNHNTQSKEEAKKAYASKEIQCNLLGSSLMDCETIKSTGDKNDEYRIDITGDVKDLIIGPQVHYEGNNQVYNICSSPIPFNINIHGATLILDPSNSQEIISRNSESVEYTKLSTNGLSWHSVQTECNEETRNNRSVQETVVKNLNEDTSQYSKIQKPSISENDDILDDWNPLCETDYFSIKKDNARKKAYSFNGFVPTLYCSDKVGKHASKTTRRSCGRGKILYGPVCIGRHFVINDR